MENIAAANVASGLPRLTANVYHGSRVGRTVTVNGKILNPARSLKVRNHSPDGFEWGYGGSGPAQLALAILLNEFGDVEHAELFYQRFKWKVVANLPHDEWTLTSADICEAIKAISTAEQAL